MYNARESNDEMIKNIIIMYDKVKEKLSRLRSALGNSTSKMYSLEYMYKNAINNKLYRSSNESDIEAYNDLKVLCDIIDDDMAIYKYLLSKNQYISTIELTFDEGCQFMIKTTNKQSDLLYKIKKYMEEETKPEIIDIDFGLWGIESSWDVSMTIEQYRLGNVTQEQMCYWFYHNLHTDSIETINVYENGYRYIVTISDLDDMIDILPKYIDAYLDVESMPKICLCKEGIIKNRGVKYLVIKPNPKYEVDYLQDVPNEYKDIMQYIKSNTYVVVTDIEARWYVNNGSSGYRGLLSYLSGHSVNLVHSSIPIEIGQLLRCKTHAKKPLREQICYFYYNGTIPEGIKLPRAYYNMV